MLIPRPLHLCSLHLWSALALGAFGCAASALETDDHDTPTSDATSELSAAARRTRAGQIRDIAAKSGVTNGALLAGIAQVETGMAHCWSEATWACQGPHASFCGGPVIAGAGDGACSSQQGGLGMFQFDGGTYSQTIARDGAGILELDGNISHAVDFLVNIVIRDISGVTTRAQAIAWMNSISIASGNARFTQWSNLLACRYNGACGSTSQASKYANATLSVLTEFGGGFWNAPPTKPAPQWYVFAGDWDGNGTKTPGMYHAPTHRWILSNHNAGGGVDADFQWGGGDNNVPVVGDWNGDGKDSPGLYNLVSHVWTLSNHNSPGGVDAQFGWGGGLQVPLAGDWNGDGIDTPGLYNPVNHVWTLSNHNSPGGVDAQFGWGGGSDVPVVGDWDGNGTDTPGLYNRDTHVWGLSNFNAPHGIDHKFAWGGGDPLPLVGDWNGDGTDTPGLFTDANRVFGLSNINAGGGVAAQFGWGPVGDYTVAGAF
jgi:hypothetical protein